ncbi:NAD(P)/FAD-dependent oxidoreductase [Pseudomonas piscis]|uniref:NAD(P)/FAD-dependent oxidoreductase n=1 Tax=Pseudomonas piscis TaxID=2614538 RepID=UPI0021D5B185|nr:tryptophan 7-halogenase [Pseudomonas piscis]MCU7646185.1 tryptophan 7-halogenase [Pseudomonas piscis]
MMNKYDVIIIGSGISGALTAAILAKSGLKVLVLDAAQHPRFSIGEAMTPESGLLLRLLSQRFGIPEIEYLSSPDKIIQHVGSSACGLKLGFSFAWHQQGAPSSPEHLVAPSLDAPEAHLFRQDVDAFAMLIALKYGAELRQNIRIEGINLEASAVQVRLPANQVVQASFIIDAAAQGAPLARQLGVRTTEGLETDTCSFFTHMLNVKSYEDALAPLSRSRSPIQLFQSTLHHIFEEGWLWVIPFNNHPQGTNLLCSVGFQFNHAKYRPTEAPEVEFRKLLKKYPAIAEHFKDAVNAREWIYAPRINYRSTQCVGNRFCLLPQAAGFIDPLFSRGLITTFESILRLAPKVLEAARKDDWQRANFIDVEQHCLNAISTNDQLVSCSYEAFKDFHLWNVWHRVWLSGSNLCCVFLQGLLQELQQYGDDQQFDLALGNARFPGRISLNSPIYEHLFEQSCLVMRQARDQCLPAMETARALHELLKEHEPQLLPFGYSRISNRFIVKSPVLAD